MINKNVLQSIIAKYYLNGLNNQVKWRIKDNTLTIYAGDKGRVCKVVLKDFNFEDSELGIFDTNKLNKLISITSGDLLLTPEKIKAIYSKIHISDSNFDLTYSLADTLILGKVSYYNDPDDYEIELQLSNEDIDHLIKAKNALSDVDNMLISSAEDMDGNKVCEFLFGDNEGFSNKITYQLQGTIKKDSITLPFNSNIFKDILNANKDMSYGTLKLSEAGMIKLNFYSDDDLMSSEYFVARNE